MSITEIENPDDIRDDVLQQARGKEQEQSKKVPVAFDALVASAVRCYQLSKTILIRTKC